MAASFTYEVEPEVCIHYCRYKPSKIKTCINVYHAWPNNYAELYAYYQLRKYKFPVGDTIMFVLTINLYCILNPHVTVNMLVNFNPQFSFKWGSKKRWKKLSKKWQLPGLKRKRIWRSCNSNIVCPGPPTRRPPGPVGVPGVRPLTLKGE